MVVAVVVVAGLLVGSFLNVCIHRIPHGESVVSPRSRCPDCKTPLAWYENVPVISYAVLLGRCRHCKERISPRYPLVEIVTAVAFFALYRSGFDTRELVLYMALTSAFIVITLIDFDYKIIPDMITIPSISVAPAVAFFWPHLSFIESVWGILVGGGVLWLIAHLYMLIRRQEGMGLGDVKLLAMIGGFLGWQGAMFSLVIGSVAGSIIGLGLMLVRRGRLDMEIPFGPFLAGAAYVHLLGGPEILAWYFGR